jgi:decaprenyl-phosphate phosphoribosyltransferase
MQLYKQIICVIRPRQWVKSVFVFVPLFFSKNVFNAELLLSALYGAIVFSLASSVAYIFNDILDRRADALHVKKCTRPIAAGTLSIRVASILCVSLLIISLNMAFFFDGAFFLLILCYFLLNVAYSTFLKQVPILDVCVLVLFFLSRLLAGSLVTGISLSTWLVLVASLLAFFLGFCKRRQDLLLCNMHSRGESSRKIYSLDFLNKIIFTVAPGVMISYLFYAMHNVTVTDTGSYGLMASVPFVWFGIIRYLQLIYREVPESDVLLVVYRDQYMQINLVLYVLVCFGVLYLLH